MLIGIVASNNYLTYLCETGSSIGLGNWEAQSQCWGFGIRQPAWRHTRNTRTVPRRRLHWSTRASGRPDTGCTTRSRWLLRAPPGTWSDAGSAVNGALSCRSPPPLPPATSSPTPSAIRAPPIPQLKWNSKIMRVPDVIHHNKGMRRILMSAQNIFMSLKYKTFSTIFLSLITALLSYE